MSGWSATPRPASARCGGGADRPCIGCGHERVGTPDRTRLEIRNGELVWICRPCADDEAQAQAPVVHASVCERCGTTAKVHTLAPLGPDLAVSLCSRCWGGAGTMQPEGAVMASLKRWIQVGQRQFQKWTDKGQELEGIWRGQRDRQHGPLGMIDAAEGRVSFPLHTVLLNRMESVREGAEVKIIYLGTAQSKKGQAFKNFDVYVASVADLQDDEPAEEGPF
jgi:hypothetical protein